MERVEIGPHVLYRADCRDVLPELELVNAIITDPPYSERTHDGHDRMLRANMRNPKGKDNANRREISYDFLSIDDCIDLASTFSDLCTGWIVWMCDHVLARTIETELLKAGRYVFAPLPYYAPGSRVRLSGDGPSSWTIWIIVARTKAQKHWGTLPGGYVIQHRGRKDLEIIGGKPTKLMEALVRDYSRHDDVVLDPFMGSGTTGVACINLGRRFIGIEIDQEHFDSACKRIAYAESQLRLFA